MNKFLDYAILKKIFVNPFEGRSLNFDVSEK